MKKIFFSLLFALVCTAMWAQATEKTISIEVKNNWKKEQADAPVVIKLNDLGLDFQAKSATVWDGSQEIPSQLDDLNNDRKADELAFVIDLPANGKKTLKVTLSSEKNEKQYKARVFAEMLVSDKKGKHVPIRSLTIPGTSNIYNQLHHHGPAFESELVAYRLYFDQKQTVDPYGKFNKGLEIEESQFYPTDEQLARGFGDDVLRVGGSAGVGALKGWNGTKATHIEPVFTRTERILAYGPVRTVVEIEANEWEYQGASLNMINRYTLYAGHRDAIVETFFEEPLKDETFCTGVQDIKGSVAFSDHKGLIASWGTDWPVNDTVKYAKETIGMAAYVPQKYVKQEVRDNTKYLNNNYLYTIGAKGEKYIRYYIMFTSMKETFGYKTPEAWFAYVREWKEELDNPVTVTLK
ncbi:DUF4861 domain-containing protein [Bacteroides sp. 51]|uniref:DUF4861 domain-containing protein n=1 Tax=Bacteroides sp. 51 TaxID=2302938 RepID=UPI0013D0CE4C|nr:DUF4861 domain-containing protein [Bacteroides sp. 51]NDV81242.1 DUF4861 domain-containing protein [Bacteroides sp. 51]